MADQTIGVTNQSTLGVSPVDVSQLTNQAGTVMERQRMIVGDNSNVNQFMDVDMLLQERRANEFKVQLSQEQVMFAETLTRYCARVPTSDIRGRFDRGYR
jgi:uncharacterized protein YpmS